MTTSALKWLFISLFARCHHWSACRLAYYCRSFTSAGARYDPDVATLQRVIGLPISVALESSCEALNSERAIVVCQMHEKLFWQWLAGGGCCGLNYRLKPPNYCVSSLRNLREYEESESRIRQKVIGWSFLFHMYNRNRVPYLCINPFFVFFGHHAVVSVGQTTDNTTWKV